MIPSINDDSNDRCEEGMEELDYNQACFKKHWLATKEQHRIKNKTITIARLGSMVEFHLLTGYQLGTQNLHDVNPDHFNMANFTRQIGASIS